MEGIPSIVDLAQGGIAVVALGAVVVLWRRLNEVTDRFTNYLERSAEKGDQAAQEVLRK